MFVKCRIASLTLVFAGLLWVFQGNLASAAESVFISEFMAVNDATLVDEDGDFSDWIEIHNGGTTAVNLNGWFLTDKFSQLTEWQFPNTEIGPNGYLIVFASGKNRRLPGAPLHTNFKLSSGGEYLALVKPDGTNVVSSFSPIYPLQVNGISYGIPVQATPTTLIATGAIARVLVPQDGSLGNSWTQPDFDDSAWWNTPSGIGFDATPQIPFTPMTIADSVAEFSGTQGQDNWFYGYWNKQTDSDGYYADSEFIKFPDNYWTGAIWDWPGDPPFTRLTALGGRPSANDGFAGRPDHWAVRRYINEYDGPVTISGTLSHSAEWVYVTATGVAASGLLYIYHSGAGVGYIDDIKLVVGSVPEVGQNLVQNGDFESGSIAPWTVSPNLIGSTVTTAVTHSGARSLRVVSTAAGTTQTSSIYQNVNVTVNQTYTLSYWYLPAPKSSPLVVRTSGAWISTTVDGSVGRIFVDGTQVFQQAVLGTNLDFSFTVPAHLGSHIDFAIDAGLANVDYGDTTTFTARIATANPAFAIVADSAADWSLTGTQGEKNWYYGYYNRTADPDKTYQATDFIAFPHDPGPQSLSNFWDEEEWDWFAGNPPFDKIGQYWMTPNGTNSGAEHWVIRRWISQFSGSATVRWGAFKELPDQNNLGGGGATLHIFHNGIERDSYTIPGGDVSGANHAINLDGVQAGDTIDIALDPKNVDGRADDDTDRTFVTAVIGQYPDLIPHIASDVGEDMFDVNATAYLRFPFTVEDPAAFNSLNLRMKFDDGFVAYLNGVEVARANAPLALDWNSSATSSRSAAENDEWQEFNLTAELGLLRAGTNVLAIQGLNAAVRDLDFLILPELTATTESFDTTAHRYFILPTPGQPNGIGNPNLGPLILSASHSPNVPRDEETVNVIAQVAPTFNAVGSVRLIYRVMFSNEVSVPMFDDGQHGDGSAGDGIWGASIPPEASNPGQMVRYYVFATDTQNHSTRFPAYADPKNSPQYQGTVVFNPALTNPLPVLHVFIQNPVLATNYTGTRCSIFWDDEFLDNVSINAHGQTTFFVFPKRSVDFNLNTGFKLRPKPGMDRVKAFDLLSPYGDKAYMRLLLAFETFRDAGVPTHFTFPVRVQQNNAFNSVMWFVEQANDDFLKRNHLDDNGALYKIYLPLADPYTGAKKVTRKNEPNEDLRQLIAGLNQSGQALRQYLFDHIDVAEVVNFFATIEVVQNEDCCYYKNYYLYFDTLGSKNWQILPWDLDLTFGRTFTAWESPYQGHSSGYFDTNIFWMNRYYTESRAAEGYIGQGEPIFEALWAFPDTQNMFFRRWSSVQERFLRVSNTHPLTLYYERRVDELAAQMGPDAALDLALWGTWPPNPPVVQSLAVATGVLKTNYLARRRGWIFNTLAYPNGGPYLGPQPTNAVILFGDLEFNPSSGLQNQEYVQLRNTNNYSVDISGWKLGGGIDFTFKGGTVIASNGTLYVAADLNGFRARTSGPRGGQGLFVQGNYKGQLSARGEILQLTDSGGRLVQATNFLGNPGLAQQYLRITEIMYHPAPPPPGLATNAEEFEYIELSNIGPAPISLAGVHFAAGIQFDFTGSGVTALGAGESVLVVKNLAAFTSRYGNRNVAGQYAGSLDNAGENIRLEDATGEKILDFNYDNKWYPVTDGLGFSLEIVDASGPWDTWGQKERWQPSGSPDGSPGLINSPPTSFPPILVNEVVTHTALPEVDAVELYNPTAADVQVGGWYISDDFYSPKKFRIPDGVFIRANDYLVFDEHWFNAVSNAPTSFSFSSKGDEVYLFSGDEDGNLTGYVRGFAFGAADPSVSFGRYVSSAGIEQFVAQTAESFWGPNPGPRVGPVVINRIMYHPIELPDGSDNTEDEFVELQNISETNVTLFDPAIPFNTWRVEGGVEFNFPPNVSMNEGSFLLLVNFDPRDSAKLATFRAKYGVLNNVPVFGPMSGKLDNSADSVRLSKPGVPLAGEVPYILVEAVDYRDSAPWPIEADGSGAALQRSSPYLYGNEPTNWVAAVPAAGHWAAGVAPVIVAQPASHTGFVSLPTTFSVSAIGSASLHFQWRFNGDNIPGATNSALTLPSLRLDGAGAYNVVVFNTAGAVTSSNAMLTVQLPVLITQQPQSQGVRLGNNVTFSVSAVGTGPLSYQWQLNDIDIPSATNATLLLNNITLAQVGTYVVFITDAVATFASQPATLIQLVDPTIVQQPLSVSVPAGGTATLSVMVTNTATLPVNFRWRRGGTTVASNAVYGYSSFVTITNIQATATYNVGIFNAARPSGLLSSTATVSVEDDTDMDGLPDSWESANGLDPSDPADANQDPDHDGMTNWQEYIAGTDPQDPLSYLKVEQITAAGSAQLSFMAVANRTYTIQFTDSLGVSPWKPLGDVVARGETRIEILTDSNPNPNRFYRLVTPRQP